MHIIKIFCGGLKAFSQCCGFLWLNLDKSTGCI